MVKIDIITDSKVPLTIKINTKHDYVLDGIEPLVSSVNGWFLLQIKCDNKNSFMINDIMLNGESIRHMIYTGWFISDANEFLPPPITHFEKLDGWWNIVLHTDLYTAYENYLNQINENGINWVDFYANYATYVDFGTKLQYTHYPPSLIKFFETQQGINWFKLDKITELPHFPLDCLTPDVNFFEKIKKIPIDLNSSSIEISNDLTTDNTKIHGNWYRKKWLEGETIPQFIHDWLRYIGITKYKTVNVLRLGPGGYIRMHRDYHDGPHIHYTFGSGNGLLKLSRGGIMARGLNFIGSGVLAHAAVNDSDNDRYAMTIELHDDCEDWLRQHMVTGIYIN